MLWTRWKIKSIPKMMTGNLTWKKYMTATLAKNKKSTSRRQHWTAADSTTYNFLSFCSLACCLFAWLFICVAPWKVSLKNTLKECLKNKGKKKVVKLRRMRKLANTLVIAMILQILRRLNRGWYDFWRRNWKMQRLKEKKGHRKWNSFRINWQRQRNMK